MNRNELISKITAHAASKDIELRLVRVLVGSEIPRGALGRDEAQVKIEHRKDRTNEFAWYTYTSTTKYDDEAAECLYRDIERHLKDIYED